MCKLYEHVHQSTKVMQDCGSWKPPVHLQVKERHHSTRADGANDTVKLKLKAEACTWR